MIRNICTEGLQIRNNTTDEREQGLRVWLLPDGGSAPGDLIEISENTYIPGWYEFVGSITNGVYTVYTGEAGAQVPIAHNGVNWEIQVYRNGNIGKSW